MATYKYENTEEVSATNDILSRYLSVSNINTRARDNIPKYSKINSVTAKIRTKRGGVNLSTSNANAAIYFASESSFAHNGVNIKEWNNEVTTSYKEFSVGITNYVFSQTANAGEISSPANNYSRLYFQVDCTISRKLYINLVGTYYDYTPPTYKINVSTNGGGTVSGGGTFDVTIADQTKTITATPNSGYKFVKWTDSNGKTYTTASLNVTISQNSISAHSTSVTYTATFEPISYTVTVTAGTGGTVSGGGTYTQGSTATLKATPNSGYKFVKWNDGNTSNPRTVTVSGNATYTATFEKDVHTVTFKNQDGTTVKTSQIQSGSTLGTLPTVSRSGYTFVGWIPCVPAKKIDNTVLDSCYYNGSMAHPLLQSYKYTDNLSIHLDVFMGDWMDIKNSTRQIMSCTESGGWGFGYQANSKVDGAEAHGFEVHTGSYTGYDLKFGTSGVYANNTWYSFDIIFSDGVIEVFVNGTSKGKRTASSSTIKYNTSNTIFVGGEAKGDTSSAQNFFKGYISNVFIANQGTRLLLATTGTVVEKDIDYYPVWRLNTKINKIYVGTSQPKSIYVGTQEVKAVYVGTTKVYG